MMYRGGPPTQRPYAGGMGYPEQSRGPASYDSGMSFPSPYGGGSDYAYGSAPNPSYGGGAGSTYGGGAGASYGGGGGGRGRGMFQSGAPAFGSSYGNGRSFSGGRRRDSSANSFRGGRQKRRGTAPSGPGFGGAPQAKKPVFNDPFSALIGYLGHKEKVNVDFTDLPAAADGSPMYESRVVLDGTSYTAEGSNKKEAKQKMAVIALRDKFGLDASELLQTYLLNLNQSMARRSALYGENGVPAHLSAREFSGATKSEQRALMASSRDTGDGAALKDAAMDVDPADYTEDFNPFLPTAAVTRQAQYSTIATKDNNLTPIAASVNGYNNAFPTSGGNLQPVKSRIGRPAFARGATGSYNSRAGAAGNNSSAADLFTSSDVKHLLSENQRLKVENEMLRSQLAAAGIRSSVHSRLGGFLSDDDYDFGVGPMLGGPSPWMMSSLHSVVPFANPGAEFERMFNQQPVVEVTSGAYDELVEIRKANTEELSMHVKRCETVLISGSAANGADSAAEQEKVTFALIIVKHKITDDGKYRAYRFVGKGSNKTEAIASGASLAIPFVKRLLAGDKLIPLHTSYVSFLIEVMTRQGIEKASECIQTINLQEDESKKSAAAVAANEEDILAGEEMPEDVEPSSTVGGSDVNETAGARPAGNSSGSPLMQTTIRVNELEIVQTGTSKSESRENAARKCLLDVYGYSTFTL